MRRVHVGRHVRAPAADVWRLIAELRYWPEWGSSIRAVESDAALVAPGLEGRVQTVVGVWLPFRVTTVEPGRSWSWNVAHIPATGHAVEPTTAERCRLEFSAPWPAAGYLPVLWRAARNVQRMAESE